jgi:superfamily II DNA or RNA helicase
MPLYKLGRWDGTISFCTAGGATYLNLLDRLLPILAEEGYEVELDDRRPDYDFKFPEITDELFADKMWPEGHEMAGEPIILRDYQVDAIQRFTQNLQSVQEIATGAGKTMICAGISSLVEPYGRSIVIVPSKSLIRQTERDYRNLGLDVGVFYGERKEYGNRHVIVTWQSMVSMAKRTKRDEIAIPIEDFIKDVVCVTVDEAHVLKGKEIKDLLGDALANIPIRWGLTGTIPPEEHEAICLLAVVGPKVGELRAADLQERGVLSDCHIEVVELNDDHVGFSSYDAEHKFLMSDGDRLNHIAGMIETWAGEGNTLVLLDRIETGKALNALIPDSVFIFGDTKEKKREQEYTSVRGSENKVILATYGVASVGIDVPQLRNLVLYEAGKSFIRTIQSVGRLLRKAKGKDFANIKDLCSSLKFSKRHQTKRKMFYKDAEYPFSVKKVRYTSGE